MMRIIVIGFIASACMQDHAPGAIAIEVRDCYTCHQPDYELAENHVGQRSTSCTDCHRLRDWKGLLPGTHPEQAFVIARGPHAKVFCADCHDPDIDPDSTEGRNVSCIGCHTGAHDMAKMIDKHDEEDKFRWEPARPTFCRDCHPRGLSDD